LGFPGKGFEPGEQVVAPLGDGSSGAGPLTAGEAGEVAGAIPIPGDATPGTHTLRLTGASSEQTVEAQFSVAVNPTAASAEGSSWWSPAFITVLVIAAAILLFVVICVIVSLLKRRRAQNVAEATAADPLMDSTVEQEEDPHDQQPLSFQDQNPVPDQEPVIEDYDDATQLIDEISASQDPYDTVGAGRSSIGGRHRHLPASEGR
uniref:hypothetical protein n=1 Tax=Auritidibacter ignavus TaxID=678932 RepID=UPI0015D63BE7